jgi:hypothetical protein
MRASKDDRCEKKSPRVQFIGLGSGVSIACLVSAVKSIQKHGCGELRLLRFIQRIFKRRERRPDGVDALPHRLQLPLLGVETAERREAAFGRTRRHQIDDDAVDRGGELVQSRALLVRERHVGFEPADRPAAQDRDPLTVDRVLFHVAGDVENTGIGGQARTLFPRCSFLAQLQNTVQ